MIVLSCFVAITTIIACKPIDTVFKTGKVTHEWQDISDTGLPSIEAANLPTIINKSRLGHVEKVEDLGTDFSNNIINGSIASEKAKLAAANNFKCPKLVNTPIDSTKIVRENEIMVHSYCDYYIYPNKGQHISIDSHPKYISASLISPTIYDFANGSYLVKQSDKYVIRLSYEGVEYMDSPVDYDVTIHVE